MKTFPLAIALTLAAALVSSIVQTAMATTPGDLRPQDPVRPQVNIPLGKQPGPSLASEPRAQRRIGSASATSGGINDASARCEAEADPQARLSCRNKLAQASGKR